MSVCTCATQANRPPSLLRIKAQLTQRAKILTLSVSSIRVLTWTDIFNSWAKKLFCWRLELGQGHWRVGG
ncbi:hypothetical protein ECG_08946 [Echinococcus granulosus]|nr:hypothetical protein ECG_08946 [Echinococcus granulosus]